MCSLCKGPLIVIIERGAQSRQVHCEAFEIGERAVRQRSLMRGAQNHAGRLVCLECFLPKLIRQILAVVSEFWTAKRALSPHSPDDALICTTSTPIQI